MPAPTISQRIALEGADEIIRQLQTLGESGRRAIDQLAQAAQSSQSPMRGLSEAMDKLGKAASDFGQKARGAFGDLRNHLPTLETLGKVLGVSIAAGATGAAVALVEFATHAGKAAFEVQRAAQETGLSVEAFQGLKFAAQSSGVEIDKFRQAMFRFGLAVEDAAKKQEKAAVSLADSLIKGLGNGQVVLQKVANSFVTMVNAGQGLGAHILQPVKLTAEQMEQLRLAAGQVQEVLGKAGVSITVDQLARKLLEMGNASEAARQQLRELGVSFPARTVEEAVRLVGDTTIDKFSKMGIAIKKFDESGRLVGRTQEEIFRDFAERLSKIEDPVKRLDAAADVFTKRAARQLVPLLSEGAGGIDKFVEKARELGIVLSGVQTQVGKEQEHAWHEFTAAIEGARVQMGLAFAPAITEGLSSLTKIIRESSPELQKWADELGHRLTGAVRDFLFVLQGGQGPIQNEWIRDLLSRLDAVRVFFTDTLPSAFGSFMSAADKVAQALNGIFGTNFTGEGVAMVAILGLMTGAFQTMAIVLGALVPLAIALGGAIAAVVAGAGAVPAAIAAIALGLTALVIAAWGGIKQSTAETIDWLSNRAWDEIKAGAAVAWNAVVGIVQSALGGMLSAVSSWVADVVAKLASIASALRDAFSGAAASGVPAGGGGEAPSPFAAGGPVRGAGTGTSDSILAWLSNGEFVQPEAAVRHYGVAFMEAVRQRLLPISGFSLGGLVERLSASLMPLPAFAGGGLALAGAPSGGRALTLVIDGKSFDGLFGSADAVERLERFAIATQARSTGRAPSWRR
jgi:hypothetical protein